MKINKKLQREVQKDVDKYFGTLYKKPTYSQGFMENLTEYNLSKSILWLSIALWFSFAW